MQRVRMGVIGVGTFGEHHARIFSEREGVELVGVADLDADRARSVARKYGAGKWFVDYRGLLECDIDAVSIVVPDFAHRAPCVDAAEAGLHILLEKPLATTVEDGRAILQAVDGAGVRLMLDFANRWSPPCAEAKRRIAAGELGEILYINIALNDTVWVPTEMLSWSERSSVLWFLGSHTFDLARWLLGSELKNAEARTSYRVLAGEYGIETPDFYLSELEFNCGALVRMENSWILPRGLPTVFELRAEIVGSGGKIAIDAAQNGCIRVYDHSRGTHPDTLCLTESGGQLAGFNVESIMHFVHCLREGREPEVSSEDALAVTRGLVEIEESARPVKG